MMYKNVINSVKIQISMRVLAECDSVWDSGTWISSTRAGWCRTHKGPTIPDCVTGEVNCRYGQDSHPYTWHWVPLWRYKDIPFGFQLPLQEDVDFPHSVAHRKVDGVIWPPLFQALESPCWLPKADRCNTGYMGNLCCFGILSGRQVGYLSQKSCQLYRGSWNEQCWQCMVDTGQHCSVKT